MLKMDGIRPGEEHTIEVNLPCRALIGRTDIVYGNTPVGIRKKHIQQIASKMGLDVGDLCSRLIAYTEDEAFKFLEDHYKSLNTDFEIFFNNFTQYQSKYLTTESEKNLTIHKTSAQRQANAPIKRTNQEVSGNASQTYEGTPNNTPIQPPMLKDIQLTNTTVAKPNVSDSFLTDQETHVESILESKPSSIFSDDSGSLISILFDDSNSELKKKIKLNSSPKKYNTTIETLLFDQDF